MHFHPPQHIQALRMTGRITNQVNPTEEVVRHTTCRKLRNTLRTACARVGIKVPLLCFERWLCRCKLYERRREGEGANPMEHFLPNSPWIDDAFAKDLQRGGYPNETAHALVAKLTQQSVRGLERMLSETDKRKSVSLCPFSCATSG